MSSQSESEMYAPEGCHSGSQEEKFQRYNRRIQKVDQNGIEGKWTDEQSLQYVLFMDFHQKIFISKEKRKSTRIFKSLSTFLKTRTPRQCRSHFQKLMTKFKTLKKVKHFYQQEIGPLNYQQRLASTTTLLKHQRFRNDNEDERELIETETVGIQTDPMRVSLADLPEAELARLVDIVDQQYKTRMNFWMNPSFNPMQFPGFPPSHC